MNNLGRSTISLSSAALLVAAAFISGALIRLSPHSEATLSTLTRLHNSPRTLDSSWCLSNPFLTSWNPANFQRAAESIISARTSFVRATHSKKSHYASGWDRFVAPEMQTCEPLQRFPEDGDGGKVLCALDALRSPCVIYSLGSHLEFDFELLMVAKTPCEVFTFDCTVDAADLPPLPPRIHFYSICLGEDNAKTKSMSLGKLASEFGHKEISLLKMDIEGHEFSVVEGMYRLALAPGSKAILPAQISFEQHYFTGGLSEEWGKSGLSAGDMALLWVQLTDLGYIVVSRENNPVCPQCVEFTVARAFC